MRDIAETLAAGFHAEGVHAQVVTDGLPTPGVAESFDLVVAPHEYFPLFFSKAIRAASAAALCRELFVLNVEQPGGPWFEIAFDVSAGARHIFDISRDGATEFGVRGRSATHVPLGVAPGSTLVDPNADRPIDIVFLGHNSKRREQFFAKNALMLSRFNCVIALSPVERPRLEGSTGYYSGEQRSALLSRSKILLNVHSSDRHYFETHRALLALSAGCLLVTESSRATAPFVNDRDFVMTGADRLIEACERYLADPARRLEIASAGQALLTSDLDVRASCRQMIDLMQGRASASESDPAMQLLRDRNAVVERLAAAISVRTTGRTDWNVERYGPRGDGLPTVSVVISLHNYAQYVDQCLMSVLDSDFRGYAAEIVMVDDASTDESISRARNVLSSSSLPATLVLKQTNTGLADTRNLGLKLARGEFVFVLDVDNWIFPQCLATLVSAIRTARSTASYAMIQRFDDDTGEAIGLLSAAAWDVDWLVAQPYIDAMAMFDRQRILDLGGYATDLVTYGWFGWEDYDLWLRIADAGDHCEFVPQILSAYRVHETSMIRRTNLMSEGIASHLATKFSGLLARHKGSDRVLGFPTVSPASPGGLTATTDRSPEELGRRVHDLERQIDEILRSKSWRITRPLRRLVELVARRPSGFEPRD
ncbi:MAG TPA: glycosyltransferase [Vicinamibacterales bacterium]|nr:glycosyltransferase [Vicinamibacterales bacterium]